MAWPALQPGWRHCRSAQDDYLWCMRTKHVSLAWKAHNREKWLCTFGCMPPEPAPSHACVSKCERLSIFIHPSIFNLRSFARDGDPRYYSVLLYSWLESIDLLKMTINKKLNRLLVLETLKCSLLYSDSNELTNLDKLLQQLGWLTRFLTECN